MKFSGKIPTFDVAGLPFHQHIAVIDCVLPFACRNYSTNVTCRAFTGKIRALHNDIRHI